MYKKLINIVLVVFLVLLNFGKTTFIHAEDDEEDVVVEKSNRDKCIEDKDEEACLLVAKEAREIISNIDKEIDKVKNNRDEAAKLATKYKNKAEGMQEEIDALKAKIDDLKLRIEALEKQIEENQQKIEELNSRVKNRMANYQTTMHFNGYLEFILGSKSFSDMLRRIYGVEAVLAKDKADREEYLHIIQQLETDKQALADAKVELDISYQELVDKQTELIRMQEFYEEQEAQAQIELDEMTKEKDEIFESFDDLREVLKDVGYVMNDGFVAAIKNSYIGSTVWNYSKDFLNGRWHLGCDYHAYRGQEIHAPAGGVVIRANGDCNDPGYLLSSCGEWISGGGNQVYLMCEVDGIVYGFMFFHLNTLYVEKGDYVFQDEVIGLVGSSGSSTGPHCHIEMYKLGEGTLAEYLSMNWNATFSVGRGETAYNNRCEAGKSAPCILNPSLYLPE